MHRGRWRKLVGICGRALFRLLTVWTRRWSGRKRIIHLQQNNLEITVLLIRRYQEFIW